MSETSWGAFNGFRRPPLGVDVDAVCFCLLSGLTFSKIRSFFTSSSSSIRTTRFGRPIAFAIATAVAADAAGCWGCFWASIDSTGRCGGLTIDFNLGAEFADDDVASISIDIEFELIMAVAVALSLIRFFLKSMLSCCSLWWLVEDDEVEDDWNNLRSTTAAAALAKLLFVWLLLLLSLLESFSIDFRLLVAFGLVVLGCFRLAAAVTAATRRERDVPVLVAGSLVAGFVFAVDGSFFSLKNK